ncbi:MAG TPA: LuxR C-terminal-related transcriptional regulator [Nocardioides sp.]|nr:LuxR C-terminal-related transcriptional regulator [Nocardioides sp.]
MESRSLPLDENDLALLAQLASGAQVEVIARRLSVSERTIRRRTRGICERLGVDTTVQAIVWAAHRRLV